MKQFFKYFAASSLAIFISFGAMILIGFGIVFSIAAGTEKTISVKENSILEIDFNFALGETSHSEFAFDQNGPSVSSMIGLDELNATLKHAKEDDKIKGIFLNLSSASYQMATLKEARDMINDFKSTGKFVVAYSETYNQSAYYMASVADEVYLYPEGEMEFFGLSSELMFFKNAIDKLGIDIQIIRGSNNQFKSAVEPFMYDKMSPANRKQIETFLNSLWSDMLTDIGQSRQLSQNQLNQIADSLWAVNPQGAITHKLIDGVFYKDQLDSILKVKSNIDSKEKLNLIALKKYRNAQENKSKISTTNLKSKGNIAVIYATGGIESGKGDWQTIGSETLSKAIKDARENENVKAIVLRINSPGGSALASDVIWRELELTKGVKPLIVSMGDYAASGGYYIACNSDKIYAQPTTLTGSIGVFGVIPNLENALNKHAGITFDLAKTNNHSRISLFKPLTSDERSFIQKEVDRVYTSFITKVAKGRSMTPDMVDSIGQGRVWSGEDAIKIGLVDELGSLEDAIRYASEKAELKSDEVRIITYPIKKKDEFTEIIMALENAENEESIKSSTISAEILNKLNEINAIAEQDVIQAKMPYSLIIK